MVRGKDTWIDKDRHGGRHRDSDKDRHGERHKDSDETKTQTNHTPPNYTISVIHTYPYLSTAIPNS